MARRIFCFLLVQSLVCKVLSIYAQPTIQQYLQLTGAPHSTHTNSVPASQQPPPLPNNAPTSQPKPATGLPSFSSLSLPELVSRLEQLTAIQQTAAPPNHIANQPRPPTELFPFSALGLPNVVSSIQQLPTQRPSEVKTPNSSIDSNLLNNLAIALQLLIVSNIINSPPPAETSVVKSKEIPLESNTNPNLSQFQVAIPNFNFISSSSFSEPNIAQVYKPTRKSMSLMSPYEALSSSSSYSDPIFTQYATVNPRQDFQSPYSMIADSDLFSMNDLFL